MRGLSATIGEFFYLSVLLRFRLFYGTVKHTASLRIPEQISQRLESARKRIEVVITSLTRNQVVRKDSWVRIPPLPPKPVNSTVCWLFIFRALLPKYPFLGIFLGVCVQTCVQNRCMPCASIGCGHGTFFGKRCVVNPCHRTGGLNLRWVEEIFAVCAKIRPDLDNRRDIK